MEHRNTLIAIHPLTTEFYTEEYFWDIFLWTMTTSIQSSLDYLASEQARQSIEADAYWPKWDSPWWHMLLLHEMGATKQIPETTVRNYVAALNRVPLKIFPIHPEEMPEGVDPYRGSPCHCQLGNIYQVLASWGLDVDKELPWIRPWFLRYQMADGGFNCDNEAYLVKDECPSSMVGTIAAFESILLHTPRPWTKEEKIFLDKGAAFLMERKLMHGSQTKHNAEERASAEAWLQPCFPRFYLYDILRGLHALLLWAEKTNQEIPLDSIQGAITYLNERFPDGVIRRERLSYADKSTLLQSPAGEWLRRQPATLFPLLIEVSAIGGACPFLSKQWASAKERISKQKKLKELL